MAAAEPGEEARPALPSSERETRDNTVDLYAAQVADSSEKESRLSTKAMPLSERIAQRESVRAVL